MSKYHAKVPDDAKEFTFGATKYTAGEPFESDDACQIKAFARAFQATNTERGVSEEDDSKGVGAKIEAECPAGAGASPVATAPAAPIEKDPSTIGGDSAANQAAPQPPAGVRIGGGDAKTGDPDPGPGEEPKRPPAGEVDPPLSTERSQRQESGGDPVDLFSGALYLEETDLEVPNTILPLVLIRSYRSGVPAFGPFGWNWDHNYNLYLRELSDGNVSLWRTLHEDVFRFDGADFEPPVGIFERLERLPGPAPAYELAAEGGNRMRFERPSGWVDAERIPLVLVEDRHGNGLSFSYGSEDRLAEVRDDDGRFLRFEYDECGLLVVVSDHAGRRFTYRHDEETEHLVSVTSPATTDHPDGIARIYHYTEPFAPPQLRHNIVRVEDADGRIYLENRYDEDPASMAFARVTEQLYGAYSFQFRYTQLQWVPADAVYLNVPAMQVEVMNPDFGLETYTFNYRGDLLDRRFRLNKDRSFRVVAVQFEFDEQGNLSTTTRPDGSQEINTYDASNADPRMRGKLLRRELRAATGFPAPSRIVWRGLYDPSFQLLVEERSESGATTTYRYDFDLTPGAATNTGKLKQIHHPDATLPDGTIQPAVTRFEHNGKGQVTAAVLADGSRQEMQYGAAGNERGRLTTRTLDANVTGIVNRVEYDAFGFDSTTIDGNGNVISKVINALGLMESETLPMVDGAAARYVLHYDGDRKVMGVERPRGAYAEPTVPGQWLFDAFERDVLGHPWRCELSANTPERRVFQSCFDFRGFPLQTLNPDGSRIDRVYDERGLLIEETVTGSDGARQVTRRSYDRNVQVTRIVQPGGATTRYQYDGFGRMTRLHTPNGTEIRCEWREEDVLESVETVGEDGLGVIRRLEMVTFGYDERMRPTTETVESFVDDPTTTVPVTTTYFYDPMDRVERKVDHHGGTTIITHDGLGRVTSSVDPLGNEERLSYDANSNVEQVERHHREPDGTVSVFVTKYGYDARNRQVAVVEPDGSSISFTLDDRDLLVARTDYLGRIKRIEYNSFGDMIKETYETGGPQIVHRWELDAMGRIKAYVDPTGETSRYTLDGFGRVVHTTYPNGFSAAVTHDEASNVLTETLVSGIRFAYSYDAANRLKRITNPASPGPVAAVADHTFAYDGLDRVISAKVGADEVVRRYDSRGRIVREETHGAAVVCTYDDATGETLIGWPDGRTERREHDRNGALTRVEEVASGTLGAGGALIATFTPSGPSHFGEAHYQGNLTLEATHDDRKRLVDLAAGSPAGLSQTVRYRYDTANTRRIEALSGSNPQLRYLEYDAKYRLKAAHEGFAFAVPAASTQNQHDAAVAAAQTASATAARVDRFEYDAADARLKHARTGEPDRNYAYLPGHRVETDGIQTFTHSAEAVMRSDGQFTYEADALGRIVSIEAGGATVCTIRYDALGRPNSVHESGQPVRDFNYLGDDVVQEADDGNAIRQSTVHPGMGLPIAYHVNGTTHYTLFDGRMNLIGLAGTNGSLLESYRYEAFGLPTVLDPAGVILPSSQFGIEPVFGGQRLLSSSGRYLATRRLMNPEHGLFLSQDPLGYAGSASLYIYAGQNPIDLSDPEGEFPFLAVLAIMAVGALIAGGLNATRQGIQMAEDPVRRRQGFSGGELGISMGVGAIMAPILVVAPELAIPLAGYGVYGGAEQWRQGNRVTGTFDIVTSLAPFGFKGVRTATLGKGTAIGQARGLGPMATPRTRIGRFALVENNLRNFAPSPFGRRIGLGFARDTPQADTGHVAVIVEREQGGFWFAEKNAAPAPGRPPGSRAKVADFSTADDLPPAWNANRRIGPLPFEYQSIRVPRAAAARAMDHGQSRLSMNLVEPFDANCANCSHFAGDVLAQGGFRGMGNGRAGGLYNDFTNFVAATNMSYSAPFWVRLPEQSAPAKK